MSTSPANPPCLVESRRHGDIVELHLARAPVNALDPALCGDLCDAIADAVAQQARGIVLSGGPKVFSAGLDVPHLLSLGDDRAALKAAWERFFAAARALVECPVPVVAAIAGHAPAGGCVLALCCDYRVMASGPYRIGLNETQVGLVAPEGIQRLMRRVVGPYRAERLLVAGEMIEAEQALAFGLVDELVGIDEVAQRARSWLEHLLRLPSEAMLRTRTIARADMVVAMQPELIQLDHFIDAWYDAGTQQALHALVASLRK
ncbi:enoyl-CoA hydratase/isomerase family protein [Marilutibacter chinensis]|uniref:Enoyl-CoA hydratase/isomerase family protein n=1 Tax=Marilutibacter chinensis TaxID=2912247 RepID=A0ABS9HUP6_9GAMM|nr:enoyl-CoA hydratase/isomerase family protein [Lysobacter chinensis]MCF7222606.1 enoyl-CoA hydratase/isomerase family protein [Lysobacter chinensis]